MKKIILIGVLVVSLGALVGCQSKDKKVDTVPEATQEVEATEEAKETEKSEMGENTKATTATEESENKDNRTLDDMIAPFKANNEKLEVEKLETAEMIGGKSNVIFYIENTPVKIYEYEDEDTLKKEKENNTLIKEWVNNGKFLIETNHEEAIALFSSIDSNGKTDIKLSLQEEEKKEAEVIEKGKEIIIEDVCSFTVLGDGFEDSTEEDEVTCLVDVSLKSLKKEAVTCDTLIEAKIIYDNDYEYYAFGFSEGDMLDYIVIEPLKKQEFSFKASLPLELKEDEKSLKAIITVDGKDYEYIIR